jgi:predicted ATPase
MAGGVAPVMAPVPDAARGSNLSLRAATREVRIRGTWIELTRHEFALLALLHERRGTSVRYDEIWERVWGHPDGEPSLTSIHTLVSRVRRKIEADPKRPVLVERRGRGYLLCLPPPGAGVLVRPRRLIGRDAELRAIRALLTEDAARLVTLVGPPGVGKTALALQIAADLRADLRAPVVVVALEATTDPAMVAAAIARALGVREVTGESVLARLSAHLRHQHRLLVLDNFEQVLDAGPTLEALLAECPRLQALVTSRVALRLRWEQEVPVPPLGLPGPRPTVPLDGLAATPAVALFIERAHAVRPGFALWEDNARTVAEICRRLDGLPLAIELAAARLRTLSPRQLLARLERRLPLLTAGAPDRPERQQTLRAALAWSHDHLTDAERVVFRRLAVFAGGCPLEAAEAVCGGQPGATPGARRGGAGSGGAVRPEDTATGDARGVPEPSGLPSADVLAALDGLLAKSLLRRDESARGAARFVLLQTIREYALEQLAAGGEADVLGHRHAAFYLDLAEAAEREVHGPRQLVALDRLAAEHDNLRAALRWLVGRGAAEAALRLVRALLPFWRLRGHLAEAREWLAALLALPQPAAPAARADLLRRAVHIAREQGDYTGAQSLAEAHLRLQQAVGNRRGVAGAIGDLALMAYERGNFGEARTLYEESLALFQELGDRRGLAGALEHLGVLACEQRDFVTARARFEQSLALLSEVGDTWAEAEAQTHLAAAARQQRDWVVAQTMAEARLARDQRLGDQAAIAWSFVHLGKVVHERGDRDAARGRFEESLALFRRVGDRHGMAVSLKHLGNLARERGDFAAAGAAYEARLELSRDTIDKPGVASSLMNLGDLARARHDHAAARALYAEALALFQSIGDDRGRASALGHAAQVAQEQGAAGACAADEARLAVCRAVGDQQGVAQSLKRLGQLAEDRGDAVIARRRFEELVAIERQLGRRHDLASACRRLALTAWRQGDAATARSQFAESLALFEELGDRYEVSGSLLYLGELAHEQGDDTAARARFAESLALWQQSSDRHGLASYLVELGEVACARRRPERAARLLGAADALHATAGVVRGPRDRAAYDRVAAGARRLLGEVPFAAARAEGRSVPLDVALSAA